MARILIVDDHVLNRQFLMVLLGQQGHQLLEAADGAQGLELADTRQPDLVIADILMPNMNGYEFVSRMRNTLHGGKTPVIFYTAAYHEREARMMAKSCDVRWVLPKPSDPELILATVDEALGTPADKMSEQPPELPLALTGNRLGTLDKQLNRYLDELEASSDLVSRIVKDGHPADGLQQVLPRLSNALTSLQAVSLRLTALIELGIELSTERKPEQLLDIGCRVVQELCAARYAGIGMLTPDGGALQHYVRRGFDDTTLAAMQSPTLQEGVFGNVIAQRRAVRINGPRDQRAAIGLPDSHAAVKTLLVVPVASQKQVFGWLYLAEKFGAADFTEIDERAASTVAAQVAVVYENLALYAEIRKQHDQLVMEVSDRKHTQDVLRRALRARTVMAECNHVMVHASDEASLLHEMCRTLVETGGYRSAQIDYVNENGATTRLARAGGSPPSGDGVTARQEAGHDAGEPPHAASGLDSSRPWVVIDVTHTGAGEPAHPDAHTESDLAVSLPLKSQGRVFGVLTIHESEPDSFDSEHLAMLRGLAEDIAYGVATLRTRNAREQAERNLQSTEEKLSSILDSVDNVVWSATEHEFIYLNSMVERIYGRPVEDFYRNRQLWFDAIHPEDRAGARAAHRHLRAGQRFVQEYRILRPDDTMRWVEERTRAIAGPEGSIARLDGIVIDISERKSYEARIEYLADHDALTGLANRNLLNDRASQAIAHARRSGTRLALLFLDLDRFKGINDSFGHQLGDALLLEVAARLRQVVREGDTVARQGGDEFIILLTGIQRIDDVSSIAAKIFDALSTPFEIEGRDLFVSTSIGVTLFPEDGDNMQTLLRNADTAMYRAKEERGDAIQFYSREMSERALERAELETALRRAIERKEFELFYQPKVDLRSSRIVGAEALIRWHHPQWGLVSPTRFIPMAEEIGLIVALGDWVLQTACAQNKAWQEAGLPRICVSVNLSARQFSDANLVSSVSHTLARMGLAPSDLELELTETVVMNGAETFIDKLQELQDLGVQLSIDDFGTGYSSLSYLKRFPLHHLKIDQSFVRDIVSDDDDAAITSTVISLGHNLNLKVIAEGVETEDQVAFLREHDCDEMQGYYVSRPLPAAEFASLLQRH